MVFASITNERGLGGRVTRWMGIWEEHKGTLAVVESDRYELSKQNHRLSTTCRLWEQHSEKHQWQSSSPSAPSLGKGCRQDGCCHSWSRPWGTNFGAADAPGQAGLGYLLHQAAEKGATAPLAPTCTGAYACMQTQWLAGQV